MIPVFLKTAQFSEPSSPLYYLVAANGTFVVKKTAVFSSITRAPTQMIHQEECLRLSLPRLPEEMVGRIWGFFKDVYERWQGEAVVFLYYAPDNGSFLVSPPPQTLYRHWNKGGWWTEMRVSYGSLPREKGFLKIGDAHSHCELPAFNSCVDDWDDREDGVRIVMGNVDRERPDLLTSFIVNGTRFRCNPDDVLEAAPSSLPPPREWLERVKCKAREI
jgi:hypothetical protein